MTTPKVYSAICAVMHDIGQTGIAKGRKNTQQGYSFRGIDDVYNELNALLSKHNLVMLPRVDSSEQVERKSNNGGALFYTRITIDFKLVSAEDGSSDTIRTVGEAMDSGDKSSNKAQSAAYKYAAMMVFCIPTEGDNDADAQTHTVAPEPKPQPLPRNDAAREIYNTLNRDMERCDTVDDLKRWAKDAEVAAMRDRLPVSWLDSHRADYAARLDNLAKAQASDAKQMAGAD